MTSTLLLMLLIQCLCRHETIHTQTQKSKYCSAGNSYWPLQTAPYSSIQLLITTNSY